MTTRGRNRPERPLAPEERLVVIRAVEAGPEMHYGLSNAAADVPLKELVRALFARHRIEEVFEAANGEVGLAHYEVRSWLGWHHHVSLFAVGPMIPLRRAAETRAEIPPITEPQVREVFTRLQRRPSPSPERIAAEVLGVLRRKESARTCHWHKATGRFLPRRPPPDTS
jgi:hypothetical protein